MQVNPSLQNQKLRRDLRWAAKRIRKSTLKFTQVAKGRKFHAYTVDGENLAHEFEFELDQSQSKQVAKRNARWTQVENLCWLASPLENVWMKQFLKKILKTADVKSDTQLPVTVKKCFW